MGNFNIYLATSNKKILTLISLLIIVFVDKFYLINVVFIFIEDSFTPKNPLKETNKRIIIKPESVLILRIFIKNFITIFVLVC